MIWRASSCIHAGFRTVPFVVTASLPNYDAKCIRFVVAAYMGDFFFPWGQIKRSHVLQKKENISIFICGINMCRVVSTYCTIHRVNCTSFSRQKGQTVLVNMPLVFIHGQIALYKYICICIHTVCVCTRIHMYMYQNSTIQNSFSTGDWSCNTMQDALSKKSLKISSLR